MRVFCNQKINHSRQRLLGNEIDDIVQTVMGRAPLVAMMAAPVVG
jgi:hypothetical protein